MLRLSRAFPAPSIRRRVGRANPAPPTRGSPARPIPALDATTSGDEEAPLPSARRWTNLRHFAAKAKEIDADLKVEEEEEEGEEIDEETEEKVEEEKEDREWRLK